MAFSTRNAVTLRLPCNDCAFAGKPNSPRRHQGGETKCPFSHANLPLSHRHIEFIRPAGTHALDMAGDVAAPRRHLGFIVGDQEVIVLLHLYVLRAAGLERRLVPEELGRLRDGHCGYGCGALFCLPVYYADETCLKHTLSAMNKHVRHNR